MHLGDLHPRMELTHSLRVWIDEPWRRAELGTATAEFVEHTHSWLRGTF